jgi:hypothetical protein
MKFRASGLVAVLALVTAPAFSDLLYQYDARIVNAMNDMRESDHRGLFQQ